MQRVLRAFAMVLICCASLTTNASTRERLSDLLKREMDVSDSSLAECRLVGGRAIEEQKCAEWRRTLTRAYEDEAKTLRDTVALAASNSAYESDMAVQQAARERRMAELTAEREKTASNQKVRDAQNLAQRATEDAAIAAADKRTSQAEKTKKIQCGGDYKVPRIGMTIERAQQCVSPMRVTAQVQRADGVLTTYAGGDAYFHVMDGRILAWGRF